MPLNTDTTSVGEDCWQVAGDSKMLASMVHNLNKISIGLQKVIKEEIKDCEKQLKRMNKGIKL